MTANLNGGFIRIVLIIIAIILVLSYFKIDVRSVAESPTAQSNFSYIKNISASLWNNYLSGPILYFWNNIFINLIWGSFIDNLKNIKNNKPTTLELNAPKIAP